MGARGSGSITVSLPTVAQRGELPSAAGLPRVLLATASSTWSTVAPFAWSAPAGRTQSRAAGHRDQVNPAAGPGIDVCGRRWCQSWRVTWWVV